MWFICFSRQRSWFPLSLLSPRRWERFTDAVRKSSFLLLYSEIRSFGIGLHAHSIRDSSSSIQGSCPVHKSASYTCQNAWLAKETKNNINAVVEKYRGFASIFLGMLFLMASGRNRYELWFKVFLQMVRNLNYVSKYYS